MRVEEADRTAKPGPRRKKRDGGVVKPVDREAAEAAVAAPGPAPEPRPRRPRSKLVLAGSLLAVALVLTGLAVWFKIEDNGVATATVNQALLDVARTSQVNQAATSAVETLFSYDYNDIAKTRDAANDLLIGNDVRNKYDSLMGEVERLAPQQKLVLTTKTSRSAVLMLEGDRARVMVFVDQTSTRTDQNQTTSAAGELWVDLQYSGGKWKVTDLDLYRPPAAATPVPPAPAAPSPASR